MGEVAKKPSAREAKPAPRSTPAKKAPVVKKVAPKRPPRVTPAKTQPVIKKPAPAAKKPSPKRGATAKPAPRRARPAPKSPEAPKPSPRRTKTKPQKNEGMSTAATLEQFTSDDELTNFLALKQRLAEMLARPDIHERDFKAVSVEYRAVMVEVREARERKDAEEAEKGIENAARERSVDGDI